MPRFLIRIEDGYPPNPYHCRTHAADVLRTLHVVSIRGGVLQRTAPAVLEAGDFRSSTLQAGGAAESYARSGGGSKISTAAQDALPLLAAYMAAVIHDYEHRGVNNQFLVRAASPYARVVHAGAVVVWKYY